MNQYQHTVLAALQGKGRIAYTDMLQETGKVPFEYVASMRSAGLLDYVVETTSGKPQIMIWEVQQ